MAGESIPDPWLMESAQVATSADPPATEADPFGPTSARTGDVLPDSVPFSLSDLTGFWEIPAITASTLLSTILVVAASVLILAVALSFGGDSPCEDCFTSDRIGVSEAVGTGAVALRFVPCGDERVTRIAVESQLTGLVIWEAVSTTPVAMRAIVVGQPDTTHFVETVPLDGALPSRELTAIIESGETHAVSFDASQLRSSKVLWNGDYWSQTGFDNAVHSAGGCGDWTGPFGSSTRRPMQVAIVIGAMAVSALAAIQLTRDNEDDVIDLR